MSVIHYPSMARLAESRAPSRDPFTRDIGGQ